MKKPKRSGGDRDNNPNRSFSVKRGNIGHEANKITLGAVGVHGNSAEPTSNPLLETQTIAVAPKDTERTNRDFSQGKLFDSDAITKYADAICGNWRRGVEAFLEIGRLCAEAEERLDPAQQSELQAKLPFSAATFSKFKKIGLDARLRKPEVQLLLPAAYTTIYGIACLENDEDLSAAITQKIINPDMKRGTLEKWRKERHEARQRQADEQDDVATTPFDVSVAAGNSVAAGVADASVPGEAPLPTVEAPLLVPSALSEPMPAAGDATTTSPPTTPTGDENFLDGFSLSADDQAVLDILSDTWDRASDLVRAQFRARIGA